ncbi:MAG: hypothetical protein PHQ47_02330 [Candidatus Portnoybacteria bacterium]|nr:hypothetical protein [Candidatus Portnoybacteria bacterium]
MQNEIDLQKLKDHPGKVRGAVFETDAKYVQKKLGDEALAKLQQATKELGWEINYKDIQTMGWYPIGQRAISILAAQKAFGWKDQEVRDMGSSAPKYSFIATMMMKYFVSLKKVFEEIPTYWEKHYTAGKIEPVLLDEENGRMVLHLKDFVLHPVLCQYYAGYFERLGRYVVKGAKVETKETKCNFRGDDFHEMTVSWKKE